MTRSQRLASQDCTLGEGHQESCLKKPSLKSEDLGLLTELMRGWGRIMKKYSVWFQTSYYNNTKRSTLMFEGIGRNDGARSISPGCKVLSSGQKKSPSRESGLLMSLNNKQYFIIDSFFSSFFFLIPEQLFLWLSKTFAQYCIMSRVCILFLVNHGIVSDMIEEGRVLLIGFNTSKAVSGRVSMFQF